MFDRNEYLESPSHQQPLQTQQAYENLRTVIYNLTQLYLFKVHQRIELESYSKIMLSEAKIEENGNFLFINNLNGRGDLFQNRICAFVRNHISFEENAWVRLNLSSLSIDNYYVSLLGRALKKKKLRIRNLKLDFNKITDEGFNYFIKCLNKSECVLHYLNMFNNKITLDKYYLPLEQVLKAKKIETISIVRQDTDTKMVRLATFLQYLENSLFDVFKFMYLPAIKLENSEIKDISKIITKSQILEDLSMKACQIDEVQANYIFRSY